MSYITKNELEHFDFREAHIAELQLQNDSFYAILNNVKILPENSKNRDIRLMRTNDLTLRISDSFICNFVEEGYKTYNADGVFISKTEDRLLPESEYAATFEELSDCSIYSLEKKDNCYSFSIDTTEHTYLLQISGSGDREEWHRFLSMDSL